MLGSSEQLIVGAFHTILPSNKSEAYKINHFVARSCCQYENNWAPSKLVSLYALSNFFPYVLHSIIKSIAPSGEYTHISARPPLASWPRCHSFSSSICSGRYPLSSRRTTHSKTTRFSGISKSSFRSLPLISSGYINFSFAKSTFNSQLKDLYFLYIMLPLFLNSSVSNTSAKLFLVIIIHYTPFIIFEYSIKLTLLISFALSIQPFVNPDFENRK